MNIILLAPTINIPINAIEAPITWNFLISIFSINIDNINVMMIDPPLIIWWTEGGIKFKDIYKKVEEHPSRNAGIAK